VEVEGKFFLGLAGSYKPLENLQNRFKNVQKNINKPNNTYDPSKYIRGVKCGDGRNNVASNNVDNEIKERIKQSQQVKNTSMYNNNTMNNNNNNNYSNVNNNNALLFDANFGKSITVNNTNNNTNNMNNNNNFQPSNIDEQATLKVDNPYASINFNIKSNTNTNMNNMNNMGNSKLSIIYTLYIK